MPIVAMNAFKHRDRKVEEVIRNDTTSGRCLLLLAKNAAGCIATNENQKQQADNYSREVLRAKHLMGFVEINLNGVHLICGFIKFNV